MISLTSLCVCYSYPSVSISSKARKIEASLPLTANFMAVLASAGMPPERIFRSLANVGDEFSVGEKCAESLATLRFWVWTLMQL